MDYFCFNVEGTIALTMLCDVALELEEKKEKDQPKKHPHSSPPKKPNQPKNDLYQTQDPDQNPSSVYK